MRTRKLPRLVAVLVALAACEGTPDDGASFDETTHASTVSTPTNPLDARLGKQGVADLRTSQIIRLPASYFLDATVAVSTAHRMVVRTSCGAPEPERRDTGLIVVKWRQMKLWGWQVVDARYNDDDGKNAACPTCSSVDMGPVTTADDYKYQVYAFSNRRTKASCVVSYSLAQSGDQFVHTLVPPGWNLNTPIDLGGALVDLGPMDRSDEWLEVETTNNGGAAGSRDDARLLLFDIGAPQLASDTATARLTYAPVLALDQSATDRDPRLSAPGNAPIELVPCAQPPCAEPRHFAIVGIEHLPSATLPAGATAADVETTVSLVRGPEDTLKYGLGDRTAPIAVTPGKRDQCGTPIAVGVGRFTAAIRATTNAAYGEDAGSRGDASWMIANRGYPPPPPPPSDDPPSQWPPPPKTPSQSDRDYFFRGTPNFQAFAMRVQARVHDTDPWTTITQRAVPNGAFGCAGSACLQTLLDDFELFKPSSVRLCVDDADPRISFEGIWAAQRTAPSAELKVATFNVHHGHQAVWDSDGIENEAESRNMANLLATRGRFRLNARAVVESADDAPFEWNADVVALQEQSWISSMEQFRDQARTQTDLGWRYVWGYGKRDTQAIPNYSAYNSLFTHRLLTPAGASGILPPSTARCGSADNGSAPNADGQAQCYNHNPIDADGIDYKTYVVPAKIAVRRWGASGDIPVLVVSVMLQPGLSDPKYPSRRLELQSVIESLTMYVEQHPEILGATTTDPRDPHIRIVLAGDFNMYPHAMGENRWFVRELRKVFGFAVDSAAAHRDSFANFYDMHTWRGVPNAPWEYAPDGDNGMPTAFTSAHDWNYFDDTATWWWGTSMAWPHYFPYWARTYRGESSDHDHDAGHERTDAVMLVGKGWAADDPVRGYVVMNTTAEFDEYNDATNSEPHGSPFALRDAQNRVIGVDISPWGDGENILNGSGPRHYRPQFDLTDDYSDGCTLNGCAAVESDHIPVGVRLRITR